MEHSELVKALKRLQIETGSLACLGCGHEHACSENGCAVLRAAVEELERNNRAAPVGEPLTQKDMNNMHFERVWIDYGPTPENSEERAGEEGVVLYGKLYAIDTLEGAGFEEMLLDACQGETLDRPSGTYTLYRSQSGMKGRPIDAEEAKRTVREIVEAIRESRQYAIAADNLVIEALDAIIDAVPTLGEERAKG